MVHRVTLSNGRVLLLEEGTDEVSIVSEDPEIYGGYGSGICVLRDRAVIVGSTESINDLVLGLRRSGPSVELRQ